MRRILVILLLVMGSVYLLAGDVLGKRLANQLVDQAFNRQVAAVCEVVDSGTVSREALCSTPLPDLPQLRNFYSNIAQQDSEWFRRHGWSYYPEVKCDGSAISFSLMGRDFNCAGAAVTGGDSSSLAVTAAFAQDEDGLIDRPKMSHLITLHPIPPLPSLLSFSASDAAAIRQVRALLVIDGQLLVLPLPFHEPSNAFRGSFPTPFTSLEYQFQVLFKDGRTALTGMYGDSTRCIEPLLGVSGAVQEAVDLALKLQSEEQRLQYLVRTLTRISQGGK